MLNNIKSFGMNVIPDRQRTVEQTSETIENAISGLWEPIFGYLEENENVFSGAVAEEISKLSNQTMRLGMSMNATQKRSQLNFES